MFFIDNYDILLSLYCISLLVVQRNASLEHSVTALQQDVAALQHRDVLRQQDMAALQQDMAALRHRDVLRQQDIAALEQETATLKEEVRRFEVLEQVLVEAADET